MANAPGLECNLDLETREWIAVDAGLDWSDYAEHFECVVVTGSHSSHAIDLGVLACEHRVRSQANANSASRPRVSFAIDL